LIRMLSRPGISPPGNRQKRKFPRQEIDRMGKFPRQEIDRMGKVSPPENKQKGQFPRQEIDRKENFPVPKLAGFRSKE